LLLITDGTWDVYKKVVNDELINFLT